MAKKGRKSNKQKLIDELDALGVDFEEVVEDENGNFTELNESDLEGMLAKTKEELKLKHNGKESEPILQELPTFDKLPNRSELGLPAGTEVISVTREQVASLQKERKLIGYFEKQGQAYGIVKKGVK